MPDCNSGIRVKFVEGGGRYSANMGTRRIKSEMFPNERLTP